ncbi:hypothetical protein Zmor_017051 [Zophobas morio]|uniref:AMP-binding enzyme C-terminal domain-containing protein n=1 Tax=Zophobas morio TaxID=2755281 RepID=A0AA38IAS1_9CUCU|nr:hypothetical protein Zmor_017051 [Zophobas morio]
MTYPQWNKSTSAAAVLKTTTHQKVLKRFNIKSVRQIYGATEIGVAVFMTPTASFKPGSTGKITPGLSDRHNEGLPQRSREHTNGVRRRRFVRTGDVGYYDEEHHFYIVDRLKDLIKYKAFQVPPLEIEEILLRHPGVGDAAVVGKPDERYGELAVAFVVRVEGVEVEESEVVDFVAKYLSVEKRLHGGVRFVREIPRNGVGKILRKELRELL